MFFLVCGCTDYCIPVDIAAIGTDKDILVSLLLSWGVFLTSLVTLDRFGSLWLHMYQCSQNESTFPTQNDLHRGFNSAWSVPCAPQRVPSQYPARRSKSCLSHKTISTGAGEAGEKGERTTTIMETCFSQASTVRQPSLISLDAIIMKQFTINEENLVVDPT